MGKQETENCRQLFFVSFCFPESFKMHLGRSSDSSLFLRPSQSNNRVVARYIKTNLRLTAAGTVHDLHMIPF